MQTPDLKQSGIVMQVIGWGVIIGLPVMMLLYPPGMMWGSHPESFPHLGPAHPDSPYDALHPYLYMVGVFFVSWAILLIRGAKDPLAAASLFDFGILANGLHAVLMIFQAFIYPNEHAHLWTDVPVLIVVASACWYWHPRRVTDQSIDH
jgi:hypothetical protein